MCNRITLKLLAAGLAAVALTQGPHPLFAQGNSLFSGSGLSKSGTGGISGSLGASGFGGMTSGKTGTTGGAAGGLMGALGANGAGGTGFGGAGAQGAGAMGAANSGFIGRNSGTFAGNSRAGQAGAGTGANGTRNFSRGGNNAQNNQRNADFANGGNQRKTSTVRPRQKVAFEYNQKSATTVGANVAVRLERISQKNPTLKGVDVRVEDNQLVLMGKVKTLAQARLAEDLLRLEPGVRSVRNEIEVEELASIDQ